MSEFLCNKGGCDVVPDKIGEDVLKQKPAIRKTPKAYRGELLPPSVRRATVDFVKRLEKHKIRYMVVGAAPVQFYGRERFSRDVDVVLFLDKENASDLLLILKHFNVKYPLPHEHTLDTPGDLLSWHLLRLEDVKYDALLDAHLKPEKLGLDEDSLARARIVSMNGKNIIIPSPEDYIITKLISRRPSTHDFEDIMSTLINQYNTIDWKYLEDKARKADILFLLKYYKEAIEKKLGRKKE
ncbi:MAG: hypothetical protein AOA65_1228 [Candidatus Bathyarchaeota archaeon BA1]|nr:MAG: hypothetical protein AOA65_1228 [Candidatus Bathyarchaeota archaeon BA1]